MIKNLLARLLANLKPGNLGLRPHTLSANFAPDSLIAHRSQHNLLERSILHLAPGEAAYLIINGQYTPVYEAGDYPLDPDNIPQTETADILYLNTAATARRPVVYVARELAKANGIHSGSQLQVSTETGSITLPAVIAPLAPNTVWLPECSAGSTVRQSLGGGQGLIVNLSEVK